MFKINMIKHSILLGILVLYYLLTACGGTNSSSSPSNAVVPPLAERQAINSYTPLSNYQNLMTNPVVAEVNNTDIHRLYAIAAGQDEALINASRTLVLALQGGPDSHIRTDAFHHRVTQGSADAEIGSLHHHYPVIYVRQFQMIDNNELFMETSIEATNPSAAARTSAVASAAILDRLIRHFKAQDKEVYVIGNSYGSFIASLHLSLFANSADKIVLTGSKLQMDPELVHAHVAGCGGHFPFQGGQGAAGTGQGSMQIAVPLSCSKISQGLLSRDTVLQLIEDRNWQALYDAVPVPPNPEALNDAARNFLWPLRLTGAVGEIDYVAALTANNVDLSNLLFVSGVLDERIGALNANEIDFIRNRSGKVLLTDGGHDLDTSVFNSRGEFQVHGPFSERLGSVTDAGSSILNFLQSTILPQDEDLLAIPSPTTNDFAQFFGDAGMPDDNKLDIAVLFEVPDATISPSQQEYISGLMRQGFTADYGLLQADVFRQNRDKIRVYYGTTQPPAGVVLPPRDIFNDEMCIRMFAERCINRLRPDLFRIFADTNATVNEVNRAIGSFQRFIRPPQNPTIPPNPFGFYLRPTAIFQLEDQLIPLQMAPQPPTPEQMPMITQIEARIDALNNTVKHYLDAFGDPNSFDVRVIISPGNEQDYADTQQDVIYMSPQSLLFGGVYTNGIHPNFFGTTLTHEMGHILGDLVDEYNAYAIDNETGLMPSDELLPVIPAGTYPDIYENNCFRVSTNYTGALPSGLAFEREIEGDFNVTINRIWHERQPDEDGNNGPDYIDSYSDDKMIPFPLQVGISKNPWTHSDSHLQYTINPDGTETLSIEQGEVNMTGWDGSLYPVGDRQRACVVATRQSIMNRPQNFSSDEWRLPVAWGPVNRFYINKYFEALP